MHRAPLLVALTVMPPVSNLASARPYPGLVGLAATADSGATAATNPAGITRFEQRAAEVEILWFTSESDWESQFNNSGREFNAKDSSDILVPRIFYLQRINDKWSVAASIAISHFSHEQESAALNIFDPGAGDGKSELKTDGIELGFGLSTLYQHWAQTRWGLTCQSQIDRAEEADNELSGLGPNTAAALAHWWASSRAGTRSSYRLT